MTRDEARVALGERLAAALFEEAASWHFEAMDAVLDGAPELVLAALGAKTVGRLVFVLPDGTEKP